MMKRVLYYLAAAAVLLTGCSEKPEAAAKEFTGAMAAGDRDKVMMRTAGTAAEIAPRMAAEMPDEVRREFQSMLVVGESVTDEAQGAATVTLAAPESGKITLTMKKDGKIWKVTDLK